MNASNTLRIGTVVNSLDAKGVTFTITGLNCGNKLTYQGEFRTASSDDVVATSSRMELSYDLGWDI